MFRLFTKWSSKASDEREERRSEKMRQSQMALLNAATSTANAAEDVTIMLKARLDDSLRQIEITAQLLSDALIVCHSDGLIDSVNQAGERIFGWNKSEIQGRNISDLFRGEHGQILSSTEIMNKFFNCQEGCLIDDEVMHCVRGRRRNGESFWIEVNLSHVERADGTSIVILICRDSTRRIEIQHQLEANELRLRSMFENSFDGILVIQNHFVVAANPAVSKLLGHDLDSMIAQPLVNYVASDHRVVVQKLHALRLQGIIEPKTYVIKMVTSTGALVDVLVSSTGMQWDNGKNASLMMIKNIGDFE